MSWVGNGRLRAEIARWCHRWQPQPGTLDAAAALGSNGAACSDGSTALSRQVWRRTAAPAVVARSSPVGAAIDHTDGLSSRGSEHGELEHVVDGGRGGTTSLVRARFLPASGPHDSNQRAAYPPTRRTTATVRLSPGSSAAGQIRTGVVSKWLTVLVRTRADSAHALCAPRSWAGRLRIV